jgi:hypothetical protein
MTDDTDQSSEDSDADRFERFLQRDDGATEDDGDSTERSPAEETERDTTDDSEKRDADGASGSKRDGPGRWSSLGSRREPSESEHEATADGEPSGSRPEGTDDRETDDRSRRTWGKKGSDRPAEPESTQPDATRAGDPDDRVNGGGAPDGEREVESTPSSSDTSPDSEISGPSAEEGEASPEGSHSWNQLGEGADSAPDDHQSADSGAPADGDTVVDRSTAGRASGWPSPQQSTLGSHELSEVDPASQVLVLHSPDNRMQNEVCETLLAGEPGRHNVLMVTTEESITERLQVCRDRSPGTIEEFVVIAVGGGRQGAEETEVTRSPNGSAVTTHRISSPTNLSRLGIVISQTVSKWDNRDVHQTVCFHTLTHFLNYVETEQLFRFLQTLRGRFQGSDVGAHYHLDPNAFDDAVLGILDPIFDDIVDLTRGDPTDFRQ